MKFIEIEYIFELSKKEVESMTNMMVLSTYISQNNYFKLNSTIIDKIIISSLSALEDSIVINEADISKKYAILELKGGKQYWILEPMYNKLRAIMLETE